MSVIKRGLSVGSAIAFAATAGMAAAPAYAQPTSVAPVNTP